MPHPPPDAPGLAIRRVPLASLHLDPANARLHGDENLVAIEGSLKRFQPGRAARRPEVYRPRHRRERPAGRDAEARLD